MWPSLEGAEAILRGSLHLSPCPTPASDLPSGRKVFSSAVLPKTLSGPYNQERSPWSTSTGKPGLPWLQTDIRPEHPPPPPCRTADSSPLSSGRWPFPPSAACVMEEDQEGERASATQGFVTSLTWVTFVLVHWSRHAGCLLASDVRPPPLSQRRRTEQEASANYVCACVSSSGCVCVCVSMCRVYGFSNPDCSPLLSDPFRDVSVLERVVNIIPPRVRHMKRDVWGPVRFVCICISTEALPFPHGQGLRLWSCCGARGSYFPSC